MRSIRGKDTEKFVFDTINEIGVLTNSNLIAKYGSKDKKKLQIPDTDISKNHQIDIHIYKNNLFYAVIECKSYLDSCYYTRAVNDFRLFKIFNYELKNYIFSLENSINEKTLEFINYTSKSPCDYIFFMYDNKRTSTKPLYSNYSDCKLDNLGIFINNFWPKQEIKIYNEKIKLFNDDCLKIMPSLKNNSIDMILCDLPYGITKNKWDVIIPFDKLWNEYTRIIKNNGAIILFGSQPFTTRLISSNYKLFRYSLVWEKNKFSDFLNAKRKPMKINEDIIVFYKKQPVYNPQFTHGIPYKRWNTKKSVSKQTNYNTHHENVAESTGKRLPTTILKFDRIERPQHPTQKPVNLLEWLIKTYSNENDVILDNCMGVGSTGIACINTKRNFIGIEMDKNYYDIACDEIKNLNALIK